MRRMVLLGWPRGCASAVRAGSWLSGAVSAKARRAAGGAGASATLCGAGLARACSDETCTASQQGLPIDCEGVWQRGQSSPADITRSMATQRQPSSAGSTPVAAVQAASASARTRANIILMVCPSGRSDKMGPEMVRGTLVLFLAGCGFEPIESMPDLMGAPCTLVPHAGCGKDEKCAWLAGLTRCVPDGTVGPGGRCVTSRDGDDCMGGAECDFVGPGGFGVCAPYCVSDGNCTALSLGAANPSRCRFPAGLPPRCSIPCDPLSSPSGCPTSEFGCYLTSTAGGSSPAVTECMPAGPAAPVGGNCDGLAGCVAGALCVTGTSGHCRQICTLAAPTQCAAGEDCVALGSGLDTYGACCPPGC
jgi:hypothetical protein